jgi:hypothetical protein
MTYELAKQLKDAGFPQGVEEGAYFIYNDGKRLEGAFKTERSAEISKVPTLSELIEACGFNFLSLNRSANGEWRAYSNTEASAAVNNIKRVFGSTPEEAVARLWLDNSQ